MKSSLHPRLQTLASFDRPWADLPVGDFMPGDGWFDPKATRISLGRAALLNPLDSGAVSRIVADGGATNVACHPLRAGSELVTARRA